MSTLPANIEHLQAAVDAFASCGSQESAAKKLRIPRSTLQSRLQQAEQRNLAPSKNVVDLRDPDTLRAKLKHLEADLLKAKERSFDEQVIRDTILNLHGSIQHTQPPAWTIEPPRPHSSPGVPTLLVSDLHWGEVVNPSQIGGVNKYNIAIAHARLRHLVDSALVLLKILSPTFSYPGIVIPLAGDMISGNIHDELMTTNEFNTMPTVLDLFGALTWMIEVFADKFGHVFLPCVTGNHGRDTHKIWNKDRHATSFDWLLYCFLAKRFEGDKRITFLIPDGPDAYYRVYSHRYLLSHLDQFRGGDGMIGALGPILRGDHKKRSRNSQINMEYDTLVGGHWHQDIFLRRLIVNPSLKGYDEYAYNNNFPFEPPAQQLWITHPKNHITFRMPVYVDERKGVTSTPWVSVK